MSQGRGIFGALGHDSELRDATNFKFIDYFKSPTRFVSAGWGHSATVNDNGQLFIFGRPFDFTTIMRIDKVNKFSNWLARFVSSSSNSRLFGSELGYFPTPAEVVFDEKITDLSCSAGLTVFVTENGNIYAFGLNRWSQCGVPENDPHELQPVKVPGLPPCVAVEAGLQHCIALSKDGDVYTWGKANRGQLGNLSLDTKDRPPFALPALVPLEPTSTTYAAAVKITRAREHRKKANAAAAITLLKATQISAGFSHSAALSTEGEVFVWGKCMSTTVKDKLKGTERCEIYNKLK